MLHGYCIRRIDDPLAGRIPPGVGGAPVRRLQAGPLEVWVSAGGGEPPSLERLHEHERVVREGLRHATPLPLRFGTFFRSDREAVQAVTANAVVFAASLERLRDQVEMVIRIAKRTSASMPGPDKGPESPSSMLKVTSQEARLPNPPERSTSAGGGARSKWSGPPAKRRMRFWPVWKPSSRTRASRASERRLPRGAGWAAWHIWCTRPASGLTACASPGFGASGRS